MKQGLKMQMCLEPQVCFFLYFFFALLTIFFLQLDYVYRNHNNDNSKCPPSPTPGRMGLEMRRVSGPDLKYVFHSYILIP